MPWVTTSGNPVAPGSTLTLTAHILGVPTAGGNGGGDFEGGCGFLGGFGSQASLPTGTVDFQATDAAGTVTDLGSAEVTNGVANLSTSSLAAGDYTITATFTSSDGNYTASTSQAVTQSVSSTLAATAIHVSMSPSHGLAVGDAVTYTVTVKAKGSSSTLTTPSGTVTFVDAVTGVALTGKPRHLDQWDGHFVYNLYHRPDHCYLHAGHHHRQRQRHLRQQPSDFAAFRRARAWGAGLWRRSIWRQSA